MYSEDYQNQQFPSWDHVGSKLPSFVGPTLISTMLSKRSRFSLLKIRPTGCMTELRGAGASEGVAIIDVLCILGYLQ